MTWIVKLRGGDGKITEALSDEWKHALELATEHRAKGGKAWVEDVDGREIDEATGRMKSD